VNPREYHGPHLDFRNDALVSHGLMRETFERLKGAHPPWELVLGDNLELGCGVVPGPGSIQSSAPEVRRQILAACDRLANLGARRVILMTFHGDPSHNLAIWAGVRLLRRRGIDAVAPFNLVLRMLVGQEEKELDDVLAAVPNPAAREEIRTRISQEFHGGFFETSLALHLAPDSVHDHTSVPPCPRVEPNPALSALGRLARLLRQPAVETNLRFLGLGLAWYGLRPFPGYTGCPHLASAEAGRRLTGRIVGELQRHIEDVFSGEQPLPPPLQWLETLTLGGRIDGRPLSPAEPLSPVS
jgi:creatinine amidohydrolase